MTSRTTIVVPASLRNPHRFVAQTRDAKVRAGVEGRVEIGPAEGVVRMSISKAQLRRALLILQALFAEAERRGYEVVALCGRHADETGVGI